MASWVIYTFNHLLSTHKGNSISQKSYVIFLCQFEALLTIKFRSYIHRESQRILISCNLLRYKRNIAYAILIHIPNYNPNKKYSCPRQIICRFLYWQFGKNIVKVTIFKFIMQQLTEAILKRNDADNFLLISMQQFILKNVSDS